MDAGGIGRGGTMTMYRRAIGEKLSFVGVFDAGSVGEGAGVFLDVGLIHIC